jgi:hypothetical protein
VSPSHGRDGSTLLQKLSRFRVSLGARASGWHDWPVAGERASEVDRQRAPRMLRQGDFLARYRLTRSRHDSGLALGAQEQLRTLTHDLPGKRGQLWAMVFEAHERGARGSTGANPPGCH